MSQSTAAPAIHFAPRTRKSPFYEATRRYGCKAYTIYNHMIMPLYYEDPVADYWHLIQDVTLWDVSGSGRSRSPGPTPRASPSF